LVFAVDLSHDFMMRILIPIQVIGLGLVYVVPVSAFGISIRSSNARTTTQQ